MVSWLVAGVAILVGSVLQRLSGTGVGLVCAPVLALLIGAGQGVLVTNATTIVSAFLIALSVRQHINWRLAAGISAAAVPGAIAGALLVRELPVGWLQVVIGGIVLFAVLSLSAAPRLPHWPGRGALVTAAVFGGLFNTTAGVAAPAMVIYSRLARWEQREFAATLQPIFFTMGAMSVLAKMLLGSTQGAFPPWWFPLVVVGCVLGGIVIGARLSMRVSSVQARTVALGLAGAGGAMTLVRGVLALV